MTDRVTVLADCLDEIGWSPERLAHKVNARCGRGTVGATTPYGWLAGSVPRGRLPEHVAAVLSECLGRSIEPADLWPTLNARSALWRNTSWTAQALRDTVERFVRHEAWGHQLPRLTCSQLRDLAGSWLDGGAPDTTTGRGELPVARQVLPTLSTRAADLRRVDMNHGGVHALMFANADLRLVARLISQGRYDVDTGTSLYRGFAEIAGEAGHCAFDVGRHGDAHAYWAASLRAAKLAGDSLMGAHVLEALSLQADHTGHHELALHLARTARTALSRIAPTGVHVAVVLREALALAAIGDEQGARAALDTAGHLLAEAAPDATPSYASMAISSTTIPGFTGWILLRLGRSPQAVRHLEQAVANCGSQRPRLAARLTLLLAGGYLRQGDLDAATVHVHRAMDRAASICSDVLAGEAGRLQTRLIPYRGESKAREAIERLADYRVSARGWWGVS